MKIRTDSLRAKEHTYQLLLFILSTAKSYFRTYVILLVNKIHKSDMFVLLPFIHFLFDMTNKKK